MMRKTVSKSLSNRTLLLSALTIVFLTPVMTGIVHAQAIDEVTQGTTNKLLNAFSYVLNAFCFIVGGGLLASGVMSIYQKHKNNNAGASTAKILGALAAGTILIGFPFLVKTASFTVWEANTSVTGEQRMMKFDR
ncbi:MAG: hypothetical protein ABF976_11825 [Acetobacter syzygii]|uniref:hypothetical protein n=1 Tax=Acetobacter syzygii TaxID=146476 RepID=UPI0039E77A50